MRRAETVRHHRWFRLVTHVDPGRAAELGALLTVAEGRGEAALALTRLRAREWTVPIARLLPELTGRDHAAFTIALE